MSLAEYRRKRDFQHTPEPQGEKSGPQSRWRFVVHKHAARRLHYDLRLELDGTLKSWAVPKGPCLDPAQKRLAVATEDHPLEYLNFEGVIPQGGYGAGAMIVWDQGEWEADGAAGPAFREGMLKFRLAGQKLRGRWMLVRMKPRPGDQDKNWLLVKERDEFARPLTAGDVLGELPQSVLSGRSTEELAAIAAQTEPLPQSDAVSRRRRTRTHKPPPTSLIPDPQSLRNAARGAVLKALKPQLASPTAVPPTGDRWLHEIKFDGYRLVCFLQQDHVRLQTRHQQDWTGRFPHLVAAAQQLPVESAILDGEVVGLLPSGVSSFPLLQSALKAGHPERLVYFAFDLLYLDGYDLRKTPLEARKQALHSLLLAAEQKAIQFADHLSGDGPAFFEQCRRHGLEGVVSKRRDRPYREGRTTDWLKCKCIQRDEFVIGGFTEPEGAREGLGALLVGYFDAQRQLVYAGKVGTGFDTATLTELRQRLDAMSRVRNPFVNLPRDKVDRGTHWVQPRLVAQVQYANWTGDGLLRHPVFQGLHEDIPASSVVRQPQVSPVAAGPLPRPDPDPRATPAPDRRSTLRQSELDQLATVRMTHPDRVLYPEPQLTKLDVATYYAEVAEWILPHLAGRPLSLVRCPDGQGAACFFQKHPKLGIPDAVRRISLATKGLAGEYLSVDDLAGLVSLVQVGVLEIHPWGARLDRIERPDRLIFDLDPAPDVPWQRVIDVACRVRDVLQVAGLTSFVKTTGGKGLHVVLPIQRRHDWAEAKAFCQAVARRLVADDPRQLTLSPSKQARSGRIYIDYHRNSRGATAIAPYSTRDRPQATVAVPLAWEELSERIGPDHFTVNNVASRLAALDIDPWGDMHSQTQSLTARVKQTFGL